MADGLETRGKPASRYGAPTSPPPQWMGTLDYRSKDAESVPEDCPICGAKIQVYERSGMVHANPPHEWEQLKPFGYVGHGLYRTLWLGWECPIDPSHECGPVALAAC